VVSTILRRGGAWRFAALGLLAASILSFGLNGPNQPEEAHAHGSGFLFCGTTPFAGYTFLYEYTTWDEYPSVNYHVWDDPSSSTNIEEPCAYFG
jgi:hypothetical protein